MALVFIGVLLLFWLLPSLLFLGFWRGLLRMQRSALVTRTSNRAGYTDPVVTWGDVIDAYSDPQKRLLTASSESQPPAIRDEQCSACGTENDPIASFCQNCFCKLR